MAAVSFYPEGNQVLPSDDDLRTLHKLSSLSGAGSGTSPGTGGAAMQVYVDRAPAEPDNVSIAALSYPSGGGSIQQWDINTLQWT
jgi:hypothetical protein